MDVEPTARRLAPVAADVRPRRDMRSATGDVMVIERDAMVMTLVARGHDDMMAVLTAMPGPPAPSMRERAHDACRAVVERFGFAG